MKATHRKFFRRSLWILLPLVVVLIVIFNFRKLIWHTILPDLDNVRVTRIVFDNDSMRLELALSVRNKGYWRFDLLHTELRAYSDTVLLMTYSNDSITTLHKNDHKVVRMYLTLPIQKIVERIRDHQGEDSTFITLRGTLTCSTPVGDIASHVDTNIRVPVPIPPQLFVRQVDYLGKVERQVNDVMMHMVLVNSNPRQLKMKDIRYEMDGKNFATLSGSLDSVEVAALDSTRIDAPGRLEGIGAFGLLTRILLDNDLVQYSFVLEGTITSLTGVFDYDVPVTVRYSGQFELYDPKRERKTKFTVKK